LAPALPAQHAGQRLAGLVEVRQQRVKPEAALERPRGTVLVGVRGDQRGVDVDHDPPRRAPAFQALRRARARASRSAPSSVGSAAIRSMTRKAVASEATGAEQRLLVAHGAQVGQAVAAVGQHHRQVPHDAARIVPAAPRAHPRQTLRQRRGQPQPVGRLGQPPGTGVRHQPLSVRRDLYGETAPIARHPHGDPPEPGL
jgi:hypothetical protein